VNVRYSRRAIREIEARDRWWREHRDAKELLLSELDDALQALLTLPDIGAPYQTRSGKVVLRILLPRSKHHVYFRREPEHDRIMVLSVWGAQRRRGPRL
jgi:plasmid stabilization system protein ParE